MATPLQPLAKCVLNYLYSITSEALEKLKQIIETAIFFIDAQILSLRAILASYDYLKIFAEFLDGIAQEAIDKVKSTLLSGLPGPAADVCPEFYRYMTEPLIGLIDASLSAFTPYRDKYMSFVSIVAFYDQAISYWEGVKAYLLAVVDIIDDAIYLKSQQLGNVVA